MDFHPADDRKHKLDGIAQDGAGKNAAEPWALTVVGRIGPFAGLVLPFFPSPGLPKPSSAPVAAGMGAALAVCGLC
ncbi:MAG: hypothetical protein JW929_16655 [Anaerolineales bacterium]|nr:hypothetical protein [Anaerolineales bacterium]